MYKIKYRTQDSRNSAGLHCTIISIFSTLVIGTCEKETYITSTIKTNILNLHITENNCTLYDKLYVIFSVVLEDSSLLFVYCVSFSVHGR